MEKYIFYIYKKKIIYTYIFYITKKHFLLVVGGVALPGDHLLQPVGHGLHQLLVG
jgi:hypothetical protein